MRKNGHLNFEHGVGTTVAVKSIKVKLMLASRPDVREGIWCLHQAINAGVRYYTEWLALLRQENLYRHGADGKQELFMSAQQCREELLRRLRDRQQRNGHKGDLGTDNELLRISRRLYEILVPESVGGKGDAQMLSRRFLSPLTDPNSEGGKGTSKSGRKPKWVLLKEAGDPTWVEAKARYEASKASDPTKDVLEGLETYGLKPLMDVFTETWKEIRWRPLGKRQGVRKWDRDMFQQALERLMSWEAWNQRVGEEYAKLVVARDDREENFSSQRHLVELARRLEEDLKTSSLGFAAKSAQAHRITMRALRGLEDIIPAWTKMSDQEPMDAFDDVIKQKQAKDPRRFGSHDLFYKLAEPPYRPLWREDPRFLRRWAEYNAILNKLDKAKQFATFTLPDACSNPVWARFENAEGTNIVTYSFQFDHDGPGRHAVVFERMIVMQDGQPTEADNVVVPVAPSKQLSAIRAAGTDSPITIALDDPAAPGEFHGEFGGAKIQYKRALLERVGRQRKHPRNWGALDPGVVSGRVRDVYLNLSIRVASQSEASGARRPPYAALFKIAEGTRRVTVDYGQLGKYLEQHPDRGILGAQGLHSGLRVMSVDLGLRTAASISVFRLAKRREVQPTDSSLQYDVHNCDDLVAVHERSYLIRLPGEVETKRVRQIREARMERLNRLRAQLAALRMLVRVGVSDEQTKQRNLERLRGYLGRGVHRLPEEWFTMLNDSVALLERKSTLRGDAWVRMVQASIRPLWRALAKEVSAWRREVRNGPKVKIKGPALDVPGGQSLAQLEYLERQYRFLRSWSSFSVAAGQVVRAERDSRFAVSLRQHLDNARRDRLKKLADRILMEALGYVYVTDGRRAGTWQAQYPPCQLILLEELSEYRFSNDRPPSENQQLRVWSHRGVLAELVSQAQMHDVLVGTIPAAFSSRFDAKTGAPGVRCRRVPVVMRGPLPAWLVRYIEKEKIALEQLYPGQLVPTGDGEFLVSPAGKGDAGVRVVHADLNAAHNLQKRLWSDFDLSDIRVPCTKKEAGAAMIAVPRNTYERMKNNYQRTQFVSQDGVVFEARKSTDRIKRQTANVAEVTVEEVEQGMSTGDDATADRSIVLFRDLSGFVNGGRWTEQKAFWAMVQARVDKQLQLHYAAKSKQRV